MNDGTISGGDKRVTNDLQDKFKTTINDKQSTINSVVTGYSSSNDKTGGLFGMGSQERTINPNDVVGITGNMLNSITNSIDSYVSGLNAILDQMPTAVNYRQAFQGTGVETAIRNFVETVKDLCKLYIKNLQNAENQIVESVHANYRASDEDLSSSLNTASGKIMSEAETSSLSGNQN